MRRGELKVWVEEWDGTPVVRAEGDIDLSTMDVLRKAAAEVVRAKPQSVIFDFRKVEFIDSSGLGIIVATRKQVGTASDCVVVITDQPAVLQSLTLTGLDRFVRVLREPQCLQPNLAS